MKKYLLDEINSDKLFSEYRDMYSYEDISDESIWEMVEDFISREMDSCTKALNACVGTGTDFYGFVISGETETWDHIGFGKDVYEDFDSFVDKVCGSRTSYEWQVYVDDFKRLHIDLYHHDGCHRFIVRGLTCKGYDLYMDYSSNPRYKNFDDSKIIDLINKSKYSKNIGDLALFKFADFMN